MNEPKLRFKADDGSDFPDWEKKKLEDVVEFLDGQRKPLEAGQRVSGKYPYYGASGIIDYVENYIFDEELILLSEDGANILDRNYRVCFLAKGKYWVNNHAHVLRAMDGNVNGFICEQLETFDYRKYNSGGAQPKLNQATCRAIIMNIPCLEEQQKIAEFLSTVDTVNEKQKETVSVWEERKKGVMHKLFSQEVRFKADDGSDFPDWEKKYLSDIASFHSGLTYTPDDVVDSENGILVFRSSNIQNGRIAYDDNVYVDKELKEKNYVKLHDIVVCVRNGSKSLVGKNALVTESDLNATWGAFMTVIRAKQNYEFVHQYLNSTFFKKEMYKDSGTATINQITTAMLNGCKLFVPSLAEQQKIADCLSSLDEVIEKQKATLAAWEELKKGLLQQMFV